MTSRYEDAYRRSLADPEGFWGEAAAAIDWERRWDRVLDDSRPPFYRWFRGARLNTCHNALDRHVAAGRGEQLAKLEPFLVLGGDPSEGYRKVSAELGMSEAAVRQTVTRLRARMRECLKRHIADTLRNPTHEQIEQELLALRSALVE